jgi:glycerol kinase
MILAIDLGTSGVTCLVFDERARLVGRAYSEFEQHFPRPGWVEHDPVEIWTVAQGVAAGALEEARCRSGELLAVGLANQRETVCVWDPATGEPLHRAIVWQDRRTAERCRQLRAAGLEPIVRERTGLVLDPYFSATKIEWLLDNVDGLRERARRGRAVFGTVDAWVLYKLSGELATEPSNASRTMLFDITAGDWDAELCELLGAADARLPEVRFSSGPIANLKDGVLLSQAVIPGQVVPVAGVAGDQQAALFGHACLAPGLGKSTYGTGSFVLLNTGAAPPTPVEGLLGTVAWRIEQGGQVSVQEGRSSLTYAREAAIFATGAAVQWLRDGLGVITSAAETDGLAASLSGNDGVYFVPALTGLGSPHWDPFARGTIVGLTRGSTRAHLARATLEAIAYQTVDAIRAIESASDVRLAELRVDGQPTANAWLMQFQADVLGVPVLVAEIAETTALGAAYLAGIGVGLWTLEDVRKRWHAARSYEPAMGVDERDALISQWHRAVERAQRWVEA